MDECLTMFASCGNGLCVNTVGSFRCECAEGYTPSQTGTVCVGKYKLHVGVYLRMYHRYTREIPDPVPSWSQHVAQFGGLWIFPVIKIILVRQVCKLPACTVVWAWRQSHIKSRVVREDRERICFACVVGKTPKTPNSAPWLMTPLHGRNRKSGISGVYLWVVPSDPISVLFKHSETFFFWK